MALDLMNFSCFHLGSMTGKFMLSLLPYLLPLAGFTKNFGVKEEKSNGEFKTEVKLICFCYQVSGENNRQVMGTKTKWFDAVKTVLASAAM
jgi:hypothetical protein